MYVANGVQTHAHPTTRMLQPEHVLETMGYKVFRARGSIRKDHSV